MIADYIGLLLSSKACYDPTVAAGFWKRMQAAEGGAGSSIDFLSTHPASGKRVDNVNKWSKEVRLSFFLLGTAIVNVWSR